jgi:hypothetical protein
MLRAELGPLQVELRDLGSGTAELGERLPNGEGSKTVFAGRFQLYVEGIALWVLAGSESDPVAAVSVDGRAGSFEAEVHDRLWLLVAAATDLQPVTRARMAGADGTQSSFVLDLSL